MEFNEVLRKEKKKSIPMAFFMVHSTGKKCISKNKITFTLMRFDHKSYFLYEDQ